MSSTITIEEYQQNFISICCVVSATALLVYEYIITFDQEYQLVWRRRFSAATLVFLLARYSILLANILTLPTIYPLSTRSCSALAWSQTALDLLFILLFIAFSSLRVYALSGREWKITSLVCILSLVTFSVGLFVNVQQVVLVAPPPINCTSVSLVSPELLNILTYVERATEITADILVLTVTVHQTYWRIRASAEDTLRTPLHTLILRDGTIYFLALSILNIADIILIKLAEIFQSSTYIEAFIDPIIAIIISRFMLNLREVDASQRGTENSSRPSFVGSVQLAAFVDPLGAPLEHEFSFSSIDPGSLDEPGAGGENEHEVVPDGDQEMASGHASIFATSETEPGPSGVRA